MSKFPGRIISNLAPAGYSVFFDGTGDFLTVTYPVNWSTYGSYTLEFWFYTTSIAATNYAFVSTGGTGYTNFYMYGSSGAYPGAIAVGIQGTNEIRSANSVIAANTWYHIAYTFDGTTTRIFVNGVLVASGTTAVYPNNSANLVIGNGLSNNFTLGNISNLRLVQGTALYTAAFTPPTQLLRVTNTQLLTCNSPAIIDQSTNNFTITASGNAAVSTLTPFTAYVPYNPALGASTPGIWTVDEAMQAAATRQWNMYDPRFNLTTLLLHGNGTNGAQNNTFLDSSSNNFTITRNGNTTQGTFSPFSQTGWSNFFGGTGSYATSTSSAIATNTTTFTIEGWIYPTATPVTTSSIPSVIADCTPANTQLYWGFGPLANGTLSFYWYDNAAKSVTGNTTIALNTWTHIAISVNANAITLYVNGTQQTLTGTTTLTNRAGSTATPITFAQFSTGGSYFTGYISNFSVLSGTAKYSTSFTPSTTPLATGTTNQVLLFAAGNRFADFNTATTAKTFTITGTPSVQAFSPFYPTRAYTPQTIGGSGFFDGSDYLTVAGGSSLAFGSGDFSLEAFVYPTASGSAMKIYDGRPNTTAGDYPVLERNASNVAVFYEDTTALITGTTVIPANAWTHILVSRVSGNLRLFINGVQDGSTVSNSINFANGTARPAIAVRGSSLANDFLTGYISSIRVLIGSGFTSVTVPTAPLTAITNTSLLLNYTNAGVVDSTGDNVLETVGNAQISTTQSRFGGSSMFFDGTGDSLATAPSQLFNLGFSDFTIEFWVYPTSFAVTSTPLYSTSARAKADTLAIQISTGGIVYAYVSAAGGAVWSIMNAGNLGTVTLNAWNHVAFVRNGSSWRGYVNGVQGPLSTSSSSAVSAFDGFNIGTDGAGGQFYTGYIDDLRITRFARYTAAFTPQTSQWQDQ